MLNQTGVHKQSATTPNQILFNVQHQVSVGVIVAQGSTPTVDGKKIIKAGTPISGNLKARATPFTVATSALAGVLLHDVDVTKGNANATLLIHGFVNLSRLDTATAALITSSVETGLAGKITFLTD